MGQAKRRRGADPHWPTSKEFTDALGRMGGGPHLFDVHLIYRQEVPALTLAAVNGDCKAAYCLQSLGNVLGSVRKFSSTAKPALCLLCDHGFVGAHDFPACVVVVSRYDDPQQPETLMIGNAVCEDCERQPDLIPRIVAQYRESGVISDARIVATPSAPGHA